jgi:tetratricopeptide (TPR) repeat protein
MRETPVSERKGDGSSGSRSGRTGDSGGKPGRPQRGGSGQSRSGQRRSSETRGSAPERVSGVAHPPRPRSTAGRWRRDELPLTERTEVQRAYDGPPIPEDITGKELDRFVVNQLKSLPEKLATRVARHLVAASRLIDSDPQTAYQHTVAARARAARVAVVREASGEAAYAAGNFKDALAELKAARRLSGDALYLAMMADCERALGRPGRALTMAKDPAVSGLDEAGQIEMRIVESGARRDLGEAAAAVRTLEGRELRSRTRADWSPRLRYAYAEALLADGQRAAAREWFERAAGVDVNDVTDAADRVAELDEVGDR